MFKRKTKAPSGANGGVLSFLMQKIMAACMCLMIGCSLVIAGCVFGHQVTERILIPWTYEAMAYADEQIAWLKGEPSPQPTGMAYDNAALEDLLEKSVY